MGLDAPNTGERSREAYKMEAMIAMASADLHPTLRNAG